MEYRLEKLAKIYHFECKCNSSTLKFPPPNAGEFLFLTRELHELICEFKNRSGNVAPTSYSNPNKAPSQFYFNANQAEQLDFEKATIKYLQSNERVHPSREVLLIQFLLM